MSVRFLPLVLGALIAFAPASFAQEKKAAGDGKHAVAEKKEKEEQKQKAEKARMPKDRAPRAKEEVAKEAKKDVAKVQTIEGTLKKNVEKLQKRKNDEDAARFLLAVVQAFDAFVQASDTLEKVDCTDEEDLEAAIDHLNEQGDKLAESADELEDLAEEHNDEDLYGMVDSLDDSIFELELVISHLDDLADELDGTIGDDVDVIIVIVVVEAEGEDDGN